MEGVQGGEAPLQFRTSCLCGQVQYQLTGKPVACVVCHCTTCRQHSGAPYLHTAAWHSSNVKRLVKEGVASNDGLLAHQYTDALVRNVCKQCGGFAVNVVPAHSLSGFHLGVIEGAYEGNKAKDLFKPQCHLFYGSRVVDVPDGTPKMRKKAPEDGVMEEL